MTSAKLIGPAPLPKAAAEEVEDVSSLEDLPRKTATQPPKVKSPQTLWLSKGSGMHFAIERCLLKSAS